MPLTYRDRGTSGTQLDVLSGTVVVAQISKDWSTVMFKKDESWSWFMKQERGPEGYREHGSAYNLSQAKAQVEQMWTAWVDAAALTEK
jgi:hypothetical protein